MIMNDAQNLGIPQMSSLDPTKTGDLGTPPANYPKAAMAVAPVARLSRGPSLILPGF